MNQQAPRPSPIRPRPACKYPLVKVEPIERPIFAGISRYRDILQWLIEARPGEWLKIETTHGGEQLRGCIMRAVQHHFTSRGIPIRCTTRVHKGYTLYIGKTE